MANRGQKRSDIVDQLPADKRACSSLDFRPSSSNSSIQTQINSSNSTFEGHDNDMETSSSASASGRSEGEGDKDPAYDSCDSDELGEPDRQNSLRDYHRRRFSGDYGKFKRIISVLTDVEPSGQLDALSELCELLSFCTENSISSLISDSLAPLLVKLAKNESNPDIMLLAIRAITYICDVFPRSSSFLVRHDAVPALCERLIAIEYLDVAEQCLQALEKISRDQPLACLQSGAVMAVLNYIDFFSTSIQRVALSTVLNVCKKSPSDCPLNFMEAVPLLCNLLRYEDRQLVESVAACLINIVERISNSPEKLDEICQHGLIQQATYLIDLNSKTSIYRPVYTGLIGMLAKLASGSRVATKTLFELNISRILKDLLHGIPLPGMIDGNCDQVHEVLKLLNILLPTLGSNQDDQRRQILVNHPDLVQHFGFDILPTLIQVVNSGANTYVCYGCLSVINKLVYLSEPHMLVELLKDTKISSSLAGVFTLKDPHVLVSALQIVEAVLQKLSDTFLNPFVKEGVFFAIDALITPEKGLDLTCPVQTSVQLSSESSQKSNEILRCLCYAFDTGQSPSSSEKESCKIEKDSVKNLAMEIGTKYFDSELNKSNKGMTIILQSLRTCSDALTDLVNLPLTYRDAYEEKLNCLVHQVMEKLNGRESISTFEFIESGIVNALVNYLSNGQYLRDKADELHDISSGIEKRFEAFIRLSLSLDDMPLSVLIQKLQCALSSVENFPVILSHLSKLRHSYATVPYGRCIKYPCLKVRFVKAEGETNVIDYTEDIMTVDPFSTMDTIGGFLWSKVSTKRDEHSRQSARSMRRKSSFRSRPDQVNIPEMQEAKGIFAAEEALRQTTSVGMTSLDEPDVDSVEQERHFSSEADSDMKTQIEGSETTSNFASGSRKSMINGHQPKFFSSEDSSLKLVFYLEERQLDQGLTLYQAILREKTRAGLGSFSNEKLWSQVYTLTYETASNHEQNTQGSSVLDKVGRCEQRFPLFSTIVLSELSCDVEKSSPTYNIVFLLKSLEAMNRFKFHLIAHERMNAFAEGKVNGLDSLKVGIFSSIPKSEFLNGKLTGKLEQQLRDPLAVSIGGLPSWCNQLMGSCPFLFSFEARYKYFHLALFGSSFYNNDNITSNSGPPNDRRSNFSILPRKKVLVCRNQILDSATKVMDRYASYKVAIEVEYEEEVGTGLGPTLEFYTLVSHALQESGLGMWREDNKSSKDEDNGTVVSRFGLFPRPWCSTLETSNGVQFSEVIKMFVLLGQVVAKALQDGRVMDISFSRAFYKLMLGQELGIYDIPSFDPELGRILIEFQALVSRKRFLDSVGGETSAFMVDTCYYGTRIEDLCIVFILPGYPDYLLSADADDKMVNMINLEEYVSLVLDATLNAGILRQVEAFRSGFNQVFPIKYLQIFTEEELERLLCGERDSWDFNELLEKIKFDHGYTASSPPIINLLEILRQFNHEQRRAFLQFTTGAPHLPLGGLAALNPKLTIVRKHCSKWVDEDLPSVMTCANYLKLPPYSSKERMKEKLLYAITEGQGSFHLS